MNRDRFDRAVDYLRLAVTSRCNFSCAFCSPDIGCCPEAEGDLSDGELLSIVRAAASLGFRKIRLTGGEALLRPGVVALVEGISAAAPGAEVALTTNGSLLRACAPDLAAAGIRRINVNLPSVRRERFARLAGADALAEVAAGIDSARRCGLGIKLNVVALSDLTAEEVAQLSAWAKGFGAGLRFIELLPLFSRTRESPQPLRIDLLRRWLSSSGIDAEIIAPLGRPFCESCNRLRISSCGEVYPCLFGAPSHRLRPRLSDGVDGIARVLREAIRCKPVGYQAASVGDAGQARIRLTGG